MKLIYRLNLWPNLSEIKNSEEQHLMRGVDEYVIT